MKTILLSLLICITLLGCVATDKEVPAPQIPITMQVFYDELSPYGKWINHPTYGYVWYPMEDPDTFTPYGSNGHWVWTEHGWAWISDYKWGWAPFHYGRWDFDPLYGWYWIPDVIWGPAWVIWCTSGDYYGWAPMGPRIGVSIVIGGRWMPPALWWVFVHHRHMGHHHIWKYYEHKERHGRILGESRPINRTHDDRSRGTTYLPGPDKDEVEKFTGSTFKPLPIVERTTPGQTVDDKAVGFYRPDIQQTPDRTPRPQKLEDPKNLRSVTAPPAETQPWKGPQRKTDTQKPEVRPLPTPRSEPKTETARPPRTPKPEIKKSAPVTPEPRSVPRPKDSPAPAEPKKAPASNERQKKAPGN